MFKKLISAAIFVISLAVASNGFCADLKIGYVNMRKTFFEYKKTKEFNKKLEGKDASLKKELDKKTQAIRKLRDEIDLLSDKAKQKKEPELRKKMQDLDEFRKKNVEQFIKEKDDMFKEIRQDITGVVGAYSKKNGYDVIFDQGIFVYSNPEFDVTDIVIKELNKK